MNDREKLIELIESARYWGSNTSAEVADHLIANGVIVLPCPIGTMVYEIRKVKVDSNGLGMNYHYELGVRRAIFDLDLYYRFGKTVFLTEEEAEEALVKMNEAQQWTTGKNS